MDYGQNGAAAAAAAAADDDFLVAIPEPFHHFRTRPTAWDSRKKQHKFHDVFLRVRAPGDIIHNNLRIPRPTRNPPTQTGPLHETARTPTAESCLGNLIKV